MKFCIVSSLLVLVAMRSMSFAQEAQTEKTVLVELFTSEGCSSCPPADAWLEKLDASQPLVGVHFIVVSEHVTYWNQDGWKDPYSEQQYTDRQSNYVRALGLGASYTPQLIANGITELRLNQAKELKPAIMKAAAASIVPVIMSALTVDQGSTPTLRAEVEASGMGLTKNSDIFAMVALDHAISDVGRGENGGRRLTHVAVARTFEKIGTLQKGKLFSRNIQIRLPSGTLPTGLRLVIFVQDPHMGRVIGVSMLKTSPDGGN